MLRVEDGQIVENNAYTNGTIIAQQLGLLREARLRRLAHRAVRIARR